jgi:GNAT superfamily N-acetyltransferase
VSGVGGTSDADLGSDGLRLSSEPDTPFDQLMRIADGINDYNIAVTGWRDYRTIAIFLRDDAGAMRGGIWAWVWAGWLHVANLFIEESLRHQGWGDRLLAAAEAEGRLAGAKHAYLETYSFQARPFYEARGYRVTGEILDMPPGGAYYLMRKDL